MIKFLTEIFILKKGMAEKFINIEFPFQDDNKGKLLAMNNISESAIKSDLIHLLLTNKGERLYLPSFGANLRKYIFEQNDATTQGDIKGEIQNAITQFIPNLVVPLQNTQCAISSPCGVNYRSSGKLFPEPEELTQFCSPIYTK